MSDVVARIAPVELPVDEELVETLDRLLSQARSGELGGISYIGYLADGKVAYGFVGKEMAGQHMRTYGLLHWLANYAMKKWEERGDLVE